jgi:hypothetical protein
MFVTGGTTKKKCLEEFDKRKTAYVKMVKDPEKEIFFSIRHEELERLKKA